MATIAVDKHFYSGWDGRTTGTGDLSVTSGVLTAGSGAVGDTGINDYYFGVTGGSKIKVSVWARKTSGADHPRISVDMFKELSDYDLLNYVEVPSSEWRLYTLECTVPYGTRFPMARLSLGAWSSINSAWGEFKEPSIEVTEDYGASRLLACGLMRLTNGVPSMHNDFKTLRVKSVAEGTSYIDVFVDVPLHTETSQDMVNFPIVTATTDNSLPITVHAGNIVPDGGGTRIRFKFSQGGAFVNPSSISGEFYTFFKLEW